VWPWRPVSFYGSHRLREDRIRQTSCECVCTMHTRIISCGGRKLQAQWSAVGRFIFGRFASFSATRNRLHKILVCKERKCAWKAPASSPPGLTKARLVGLGSVVKVGDSVNSGPWLLLEAVLLRLRFGSTTNQMHGIFPGPTPR
jgi:hypothetical protein